MTTKSEMMKKRWEDPIFREKVLSKRRGQKRSKRTREKMRQSAIKRNQNPEYIEKLKKSHTSRTNPKLWDEMCKNNSNRMTINNPMKDPKVAKKVADKNRKEIYELGISSLHIIAGKLFRKERCEICGKSNEEYLKENGHNLSMHCRSKEYTLMEDYNWVTVCENGGCHKKMDNIDR